MHSLGSYIINVQKETQFYIYIYIYLTKVSLLHLNVALKHWKSSHFASNFCMQKLGSFWSTAATLGHGGMENEPPMLNVSGTHEEYEKGRLTLGLACERNTIAPAWWFWSKLLWFCLESETATVSCICFIKFRLYLLLFAFLLVLGVCLSVLCFTEPGVYLPKFAFHRLWAVFALSSVSFSLDLWAQVCSTAFGLCLFCFPEPGNVAVHSLPQSVCLSVPCLAWELSWATFALITCLAQCLDSGVFLPVFAVRKDLT